jgi:thiamine pyrophosphate-dependent acetolactate synthase large subunit-like protein
MVLNGNPSFGVELQPIDFAAYARACGAAGFTIERPDECEAVLREALATPGPAVVQAVVDPNEPPMPGKITTEQAKNLAEALLRGDPDRLAVVKTIAEDFIKNRVREVI